VFDGVGWYLCVVLFALRCAHFLTSSGFNFFVSDYF
jgi:hypothetical protein